MIPLPSPNFPFLPVSLRILPEVVGAETTTKADDIKISSEIKHPKPLMDNGRKLRRHKFHFACPVTEATQPIRSRGTTQAWTIHSCLSTPDSTKTENRCRSSESTNSLLNNGIRIYWSSIIHVTLNNMIKNWLMATRFFLRSVSLTWEADIRHWAETSVVRLPSERKKI